MFAATPCGRTISPANGVAVAIAVETKQVLQAVAVEPIDDVVQADLGVDVVIAGEWIVNAVGPAFFLKRGQNDLLVTCRDSKSLDRHAPQRQHSA